VVEFDGEEGSEIGSNEGAFVVRAVEEPSSSGGGGEEGEELPMLIWRRRGSGAFEREDEENSGVSKFSKDF